MDKNDAILQEATRALKFIKKDTLSTADKEQISKESIECYTEHVNPGWLPYYKPGSKDAVFVEWEGSLETLKNLYGNEFIDCQGGNGTNIVGHQNPEIVKVVQAQLKRHSLHNRGMLEPLRGYLARLISMSAPGNLKYVHFCTEGTEAIESALNIARVASDNYFIISAVNSFHGTSLGSPSAAGKAVFRKSNFSMIPGIQHVEFGKAEAAETAIKNLVAVGETVAAMIVEPIQVAAGVVIPPDHYLQQIREICDRYGVLLIIDEIQTGMGRTGKLWACEGYGVVPDILIFGNAFGGGVMPITGVLIKEQLWVEELSDNFFRSWPCTSGGTPLTCAAAIATLKFIIENDIPDQIAKKGDYIMVKLRELKKRHPILLDVRGKGLLIGLEFPTTEITKSVSEALFEKGVVTSETLNNARVCRIEPPGVIRFETIEVIVSKLDEVLSVVAQEFAIG